MSFVYKDKCLLKALDFIPFMFSGKISDKIVRECWKEDYKHMYFRDGNLHNEQLFGIMRYMD